MRRRVLWRKQWRNSGLSRNNCEGLHKNFDNWIFFKLADPSMNHRNRTSPFANVMCCSDQYVDGGDITALTVCKGFSGGHEFVSACIFRSFSGRITFRCERLFRHVPIRRMLWISSVTGASRAVKTPGCISERQFSPLGSFRYCPCPESP